MIDFKYHLVSLISVFMALAIGVVLGAGPLQQSIGNSLQKQVSALRSDKEALQSTTRAQQDLIDDDDTYLGDASNLLVSRSLAGQHVVLIRVQNSASADVKALQQNLQMAGAEVTGTVTVAQDWSDPAREGNRTKAAATLAKALGDNVPAGSDVSAYLDAVLARSIAVQDTGSGTPRADGVKALDALSKAGLISTTGNPASRAALSIAVTGPHNLLTAPTAEQSAQDNQNQQALLTLVKAIRGQSKAMVLSGPRRSTQVTSLVATLRADRAADAISGVDDIDHPMGRISTILVGRTALAGTVEQTGTAGDAASVVPRVIASASASSTP